MNIHAFLLDRQPGDLQAVMSKVNAQAGIGLRQGGNCVRVRCAAQTDVIGPVQEAGLTHAAQPQAEGFAFEGE